MQVVVHTSLGSLGTGYLGLGSVQQADFSKLFKPSQVETTDTFVVGLVVEAKIDS